MLPPLVRADAGLVSRLRTRIPNALGDGKHQGLLGFVVCINLNLLLPEKDWCIAGSQLKDQVAALQNEYSEISDQLESEQGRSQQVGHPGWPQHQRPR